MASTTEDASGIEVPTPNLTGEKVGRYRLERALGSGAMGVVYLAKADGGPSVALKVLTTALWPGRRERFAREWRALARLDHPGIVKVLEGGESDAGPWLALELVEGLPLSHTAVPVAVDRALDIAEQIARAMDHAHRRGIVHRDLKPANVLVKRDGSVKVVDFGLVKDMEGEVALTAHGATVGTPAFMAPEQIAGQRDLVGAAADVHAIAVMLYELVTGDLPFAGEGTALRNAIVTAAPTPPSRSRPDSPAGLDAVIARGLAKKPRDRYLTALELATDLAALRRGEKPRHANERPDPDDPALALGAGDRLGAFELLYPVGRGGAGVVFKALDAQGTPVAVKVLREAGEELRARFERELRLLELVANQGEGFVPLLAHGAGDTRPWFAMPFLPGGTLRDRLERGVPSIDEALAIVRQVTAAVARAHAAGVAHRDLKPENIIFDESGAPRVADLGLARRFRRDDARWEESLTVSLEGRILGTVGYVAPEQLEDPREAGPRADVFALGAVLYEALCGLPAFRADSLVGFIEKLSDGAYEPLRGVRPEVPAWLDAVVTRALSRDPERRFADAGALAAALDERPSGGVLARVRDRLAGRGDKRPPTDRVA